MTEFDASQPDHRLYQALDSWASDRDAAWCAARESASLPVIREPSCREGCDHCCYQHVAITPIEADILASHIRERWPKDEIIALQKRLSLNCERLATIEASSRSPDSRRLALSQLRRPCPVLDEATGRCLAYEARPVNCRRENSVDPEVCRRHQINPDSTESSLRLSRFDLIWGAVHFVLANASTDRLDPETGPDADPFEPLERALTRSLG